MKGSLAMLCIAAFGAWSPLWARALSPASGAALGAGLQAGVAVARSPLDTAGLQSRLAARLLLEFPLGRALGLGFSLGYHLVNESAPVQGVLYRGHNGLEFATYLLLRSALTADRPRAGIAVGGQASFDIYNLTELLFFYPSLTAGPYLELPIAGPPRHTFSFALPWSLDFRRDLQLSTSIGLEIVWRWYPAWKEGT
jgi:hypothetical protein